MAKKNKLIIGSAIGLAAIASVLDHMKHGLPEPVAVESSVYSNDSSPCSLESPCSLNESPCSMSESPCSL